MLVLYTPCAPASVGLLVFWGVAEALVPSDDPVVVRCTPCCVNRASTVRPTRARSSPSLPASCISSLAPYVHHAVLVQPAVVDDGRSGQGFAFHYKLLNREEDKLGEGQFATVRKAVQKKTGKMVAVKCILVSKLTKEDEDALKVEIEVMRTLKHPNLVQFIDYFEDAEYCFLIMELMTGGELFTRIVEKEKYSELEAQRVVKTLTEAIGYCHTQFVVHRDLKPENILLSDPTEEALIKIADFGFAKVDKGNARALQTACGTPGYVAPEILKGEKYGKEVDIWSLGVIFYILLCGYPPFHHSNQNKLFDIIKAGQYEFDEADWKDISEEAKDLIRHMLVVDPSRRYTCAQILAHPWVTGVVSDAPLTGTIGQLKIFNARRKLKAGFNAVRTAVRVRMLTNALRDAKSAMVADEAKAAAAAAGGMPVQNPMIAGPVDGAGGGVAGAGVAGAGTGVAASPASPGK